MRFPSVAVLTPVVLLAGICEPEPIRVDQLAECPHTWSTLVDSTGEGENLIFGPDGSESLARSRLNVPEYHDCQRLMTSNTRYGPMVAVFASDSLDELELMLRLRPGSVELPTRDTTKPAILTTQGLRPNSPSDVGVAAVQVLNTGTWKIPYAPLNIDGHTSVYCIYLFSDGQGWEAWQIKSSGFSCEPRATRAQATSAGTFMQVSAHKVGDYTASDYPAVARWDYDGKEHYIGVKCGTAWCQIGRHATGYGVLAKASAADPASFVQDIKGWYDEQYLAAQPNAANPTATRGVVVPDESLNKLDAPSDFRDWRRAGTVFISSNDYYQKLNLRQTVAGSGAVNTIYFRMRELDKTSARDLTYPRQCDVPTAPATQVRDTVVWEARIVAADGNCRIFRMERRPHGNAHATFNNHAVDVIGTMRWRWLANDETFWGKCGQACCEVDP